MILILTEVVRRMGRLRRYAVMFVDLLTFFDAILNAYEDGRLTREEYLDLTERLWDTWRHGD